jgi:soluble lytic murein transglycosylase
MQRREIFVVASIVVAMAGAAVLLGRGADDARPQTGAMQAPAGVAADSLRVPGVPESVGVFLENEQPWRAARVMREYLRETANPSPEAFLLAARAEAEWGGWDRVRRYLAGERWLDDVRGGEGWYWLARALEQEEDWQDAWEAYESYLRASENSDADDRRAMARLRQGLVLLRLDRPDDAAIVLAATREAVPEIGARIDVLAAEALAPRGDTAGVRRLVAGLPDDAGLRERGQQARLVAYEEAGDLAGGFALARGYRASADAAGTRATYALFAGRMAHELGDDDAARRELREAVTLAPASTSAGAAALLMEELGDLTTADRLALARAFDARGANAKAAAHYRAWLSAEAGTTAERAAARLSMGRALFDAGDYGGAISALSSLESAQALHLVGRSEYRRGNQSRGREIFLRVAQRYPGSGAGSESLFLIADLDHDDLEMSSARPIYRRVASEFRGTDRAGLSLMRLGGAAFLEKDYAGAARIWEEYRSSYPSGERWLESTYWAGRAYEEAGNRETAQQRYREVREREPLSYYALRASEKLGESFWPPRMVAGPPVDSAGERSVDRWMRGVDLLLEAGLYEEAEAEADRWIREAGDDRALLYPLAEALNERGLTVRGIRIGLRLQGQDELNPRLLRIVYPFPYRAMLVAEAREKDLDPFVVAALVRQESLFKARISSPVGARGLMQVMPETGRGLARGAGIDDWDAELLYQPEINAHLGTVFLAEQMRRWDGSLPAVFSAYNAGPHRIEAWQRFPEYGNEELFTERIPYRETRDYVKILTRNIAVYRGLYGERSAGSERDSGARGP